MRNLTGGVIVFLVIITVVNYIQIVKLKSMVESHRTVIEWHSESILMQAKLISHLKNQEY